jgi:hypothetical protein
MHLIAPATLIKVSLAVGALAALGLAGQSDLEQAVSDEATYCEMVHTWHSSVLPPEQRPGWPPFRNDIDCGTFFLAEGFSKP